MGSGLCDLCPARIGHNCGRRACAHLRRACAQALALYVVAWSGRAPPRALTRRWAGPPQGTGLCWCLQVVGTSLPLTDQSPGTCPDPLLDGCPLGLVTANLTNVPHPYSREGMAAVFTLPGDRHERRNSAVTSNLVIPRRERIFMDPPARAASNGVPLQPDQLVSRPAGVHLVLADPWSEGWGRPHLC